MTFNYLYLSVSSLIFFFFYTEENCPSVASAGSSEGWIINALEGGGFGLGASGLLSYSS